MGTFYEFKNAERCSCVSRLENSFREISVAGYGNTDFVSRFHIEFDADGSGTAAVPVLLATLNIKPK